MQKEWESLATVDLRGVTPFIELLLATSYGDQDNGKQNRSETT